MDWWGESWGQGYGGYGQRYGGDPVNMQVNGWFNIDEARGTFNFSSDLNGKLIMLEYISDGLAYDLDTKVPKMAEEAMYQHLLYSILSTRRDTAAIAPQYKRQRYAALRNAKAKRELNAQNNSTEGEGSGPMGPPGLPPPLNQDPDVARARDNVATRFR